MNTTYIQTQLNKLSKEDIKIKISSLKGETHYFSLIGIEEEKKALINFIENNFNK